MAYGPVSSRISLYLGITHVIIYHQQAKLPFNSLKLIKALYLAKTYSLLRHTGAYSTA